MRVLVVGLGDIARKAYLPAITGMPGLELHLATRDQSVLMQAGATYHVDGLHPSVADALGTATFDAAFVHVATLAHAEVVELLLRAGVHVLVDKPLAYTLDEAARLVSLSEDLDRLLMVGFNRRYAPDYAALRERPRDFIHMQKNRCSQLDEPRRTIFDDFIHVVDTIRFLAPSPAERITIRTVTDQGLLRSATLMLASADHVALGTMHRDSGLDEERLDLIGRGHKSSILDLSERREQAAGLESRSRRPDWAQVSRQRGFEAMCAAFLQGAREGRRTASKDILETHRLCEQIVREAESGAGTE